MTKQVDHIKVSIAEQDVVCIHNISYHRGLDVGGKLYIDRSSVPWLIDALTRYLESETGAEQKLGNDELQISQSGGGPFPRVCLENDRPNTATYAGEYIESFEVKVGHDLVKQLRALGTSPYGPVETGSAKQLRALRTAQHGSVESNAELDVDTVVLPDFEEPDWDAVGSGPMAIELDQPERLHDRVEMMTWRRGLGLWTLTTACGLCGLFLVLLWLFESRVMAVALTVFCIIMLSRSVLLLESGFFKILFNNPLRAVGWLFMAGVPPGALSIHPGLIGAATGIWLGLIAVLVLVITL